MGRVKNENNYHRNFDWIELGMYGRDSVHWINVGAFIMKRCITHHHACDCREADFIKLIRDALEEGIYLGVHAELDHYGCIANLEQLFSQSEIAEKLQSFSQYKGR